MHIENLVLIEKGHYVGTTDCVFLFFNNVILKKHGACISLLVRVQNK